MGSKGLTPLEPESEKVRKVSENAGLVNIFHFYLQAFNTFQPSLTLW